MSLKFPNMSQKELAQLAIDNHLYVDGWDIFRHYESILSKRSDTHYEILVMFEGKTPVASCTVSDTTRQIAVFVAESKRGKDLGSQIVQYSLRKKGFRNNEIFAGNGVEGSEKFFMKNKILTFEDACVPLTKEQTEDFFAHRKTYKELMLEYIKDEHKKIFGLNERIVYE